MTTQFIGYVDAYQKNFKAHVVAVNESERAVALDQTAFYPGGGGQPCDLGKLTWADKPHAVIKVAKQDDLIWHWLEEQLPLVGEEVQGEIDWERRYQLMRTHTAMHALCGVVWRDYGASVTGGNMEPLQGRMDFEFETMHRDLVEVIEARVNQEIAAAHSVRSRFLSREEAFRIPDLIRTKINLLPQGITEVRIVEIEGLDLQADGGTHVANTREVGKVKVVDYKSKGKINKRIFIEVLDE